jgi:hypothetical protein
MKGANFLLVYLKEETMLKSGSAFGSQGTSDLAV